MQQKLADNFTLGFDEEKTMVVGSHTLYTAFVTTGVMITLRPEVYEGAMLEVHILTEEEKHRLDRTYIWYGHPEAFCVYQGNLYDVLTIKMLFMGMLIGLGVNTELVLQ